MPADVARAKVVFRGRVQGVFFRQNTLREARRAGLSGYVRNLPDGTVEGVFEGPKEVVEAVIAWCRTRQPFARVEGADVVWEAPQGLKEFEVRY